MRPLRTLLLGATAALACGGAAGAAPADPQRPYDPFEPVNRGLFHVDATANRLLAGRGGILAAPVWIPRPIRAGLYNAFQNLEEPATVANDLFQGKVARAGQNSSRFVVNSTVGVFGVLDVATRLGLERTREDFGQTLGVYGVPAGPYIYVPLAGPTSMRDVAGGLVDGVFSPLGWVDMTTMKRRAIAVTRRAVKPSTLGIRQEARAAAVAGETPDEYGMVRELFAAQRNAQIADEPNLADRPIKAERDSRAKRKAPRPKS